MESVFWCQDRWGREIVLPAETWEDKILLDHYEVLGQENLVRDALVSPDQVTFDVVESSGRECFYVKSVRPPPDHHDYLKVVVAFDAIPTGDPVGRVVTAYGTPFIKSGERLKWMRR